MKNIAIVILFLTSYLLLPSFASADPGVIIEAKGNVTISQDGSSMAAQTGTQFRDGDLIEVGSGGSAMLMFSSGVTKKLSGGESFKAVKVEDGSSEKPLLKGIAMAYNDATTASRGPVVHGMVKAAPGGNAAKAHSQTMGAEMSRQMRDDLAKIDSLGLDKNGKALMKAQVYYKYGQNQKMVNALLPVYKSQTPPTDMVKNLLAIGYERLGRPEEALKFK